MKKPTISICIPTYNRADYLDQTLQSVIKQTVKPFEVLVIDNASTDNTPDIIKKYRKFGISFIQNSKNLGMIGNLNKCLLLAKGKFVSILPSDDLILPTWYEQWEKIITQNKASVYTCSLVVVDSNGQSLFVGRTFSKNHLIQQPTVMEKFYCHYSPLLPPTAAVVYRKDIFQDLGHFDPTLSTEADVEISLKIMSKYDIYYLDKILFAHRWHETQSYDQVEQKKTEENDLRRLDNYFHILSDYYQKHIKDQPIDRLFLTSHISMTLGSVNLYLFLGKYKKVFGTYKIINHYFPGVWWHNFDWLFFLKTQLLFIKRALFGKILNKKDFKEIKLLTSLY
ncbi:hypothetical protein A3F03_04935 [Candidatus Roizmanbacteria bacterium RIFCSPHIGHO2_12_FULL_41_11]|uniref:Glycosyltransferase 2-like domain-containing protein n=2 Tax=Candidatus Roizmaniibacteriota TaxID=1752723 RepID=A0A1F7J9Z9_9BACT|nr:MAG: hypothetical protein A3F03_04935 [Candidatus Roizmanbacteria bacterium RIFCSPHIGHO2_12_FULL_41_11]OGK52415.1 MAG: hypothetical protein A2966_01975 [Candidatus Roizmanbacteria bacterium RIFCSPLOWO2_01_FULL_41_22]